MILILQIFPTVMTLIGTCPPNPSSFGMFSDNLNIVPEVATPFTCHGDNVPP